MKKIFFLFISTFLLFTGVAFASIEINPLKIELEISDNKVYSGYLTIKNHGDESVSISLSPGDYRYMFSANTIYPESKKALPSCKSWISFKPDKINLDKNATQQIAYTINVPNAQDNEYVACFLIDEERPEPLIEKNEAGQVNIKITPRISIPVYVAIKDSAEYSCEISDFTTLISNDKKSVELSLTLYNDGTAHIRPVTKIVILDEYGTVVNKSSAGKSLPMFAGFGEKLKMIWKPRFTGKYTAIATVDIGKAPLIQKRISFEVKK